MIEVSVIQSLNATTQWEHTVAVVCGVMKELEDEMMVAALVSPFYCFVFFFLTAACLGSPPSP